MSDLDSHIDSLMPQAEAEPEQEPTAEPAAEPMTADDHATVEQLTQPPRYGERGEYSTPDEYFNADPIGMQQAQIQHLQGQAAMRDLETSVQQDATAFAAENPDYHFAVDALLASRANELKLMGVPEHQIPDALQQESVQLAAGAQRQGKSVAELVYTLAKQRGFDVGAAAEAMSDRDFETLWNTMESNAKKSGYVPGIR